MNYDGFQSISDRYFDAHRAAAVTNAGGLGVIGGMGYTPKQLRDQVSSLASSSDVLLEILSDDFTY